MPTVQRHSWLLALTLVPLLTWVTSARGQSDEERLAFFEKKIRPVLSEHCLECHGAEENNGGLRLDSRRGWSEGGDSGPAILPHQPSRSLLMRALRYDDPELQMPPDGKLPDDVIADFERWIAQGALDPREGTPSSKQGLDLEAGRKHWAYQLPRRHPLPDVADAQWSADPIDRFIRSRLEAVALEPSPRAERAVLARRLYFDLIGLPPTPEELDAFCTDERADAYERLVDRLLASPRFGERWGRHWLDVVRYAESLTLRGFILGDAWRYRDYVIDSFNMDHPFDAMIREHLAGDLLPAEDVRTRQRQWIATTFLMLGNTNLEDQDKKQLNMDVVDEQLEVIGRAFLAQTIGCARCHDHKFDPIPTRDYYALAGILANVQSLEHANVSKWLELPLPLPPEEEARIQAHEASVASLEKRIKQQKQKIAQLAKAGARPRGGVVSVGMLPGVVVDDTQAKKVGAWQPSQFVASYIGDGYVHDQNEDKGAKTITFLPELPKAGKYEVRLAYTAGTNRASNVPVTVFSADGEFTVVVDQRQEPPVDGHFISLGTYRFELNGQGFVLISNEGTNGHVIADAVQFLSADAERAMPTDGGAAEASHDQASAAEADAAERELKRLEAEMKALVARGPRRPTVIGVRELGKVEPMRIHVRGNVHNLGEEVPRGVLQVAAQGFHVSMPADQSGRRELAEWIASPQNPLTARVFVNRAWHWLMGHGLVRTTDNFGTTGQPPSHPELLDNLTLDFIDHGWSVKYLVRRIVCSETYRQTTFASPRATQVDPENRLFSRASRRRMEAECLRDTLLMVSGQLDLTMGGPTIRPGTASDYGYEDRGHRRSVYVPVLRNALPELFEVFDFADPSVPTGVRNTSTVAPQALFMMNHPSIREYARTTAERLLAMELDDQARVVWAFCAILGRTPSPDEARLSSEFLRDAGRVPPSSDASAAAWEENSDGERLERWTQWVHALFGSIDFRYLE